MLKTNTIYRFLRRRKKITSSFVALVVIGTLIGLFAWNYIEKSQAASVVVKQQQLDEIREEIKQEKAEEAKRKVEEEKKEQEAAEAEAKRIADEQAQKAAEAKQSVNTGGTAGCNTASAHTNPDSIDVLVNKKHCLQPLSFTPPDLVTASGGATISAKAASDFNRMFADAAAVGQPFTVTSSYRSYANQVSTYNYWVSVNGQQGADTVSARPGFSEHQTGLAVDVGANGCNLDCFGGTSQYQWFQANAANYGFVQRYYSGYESITGYASEEWHYRYIGVAVAQDMKAKGIKTLEQYWGMEGGNYR